VENWKDEAINHTLWRTRFEGRLWICMTNRVMNPN
jgi:hypothetical protein